MSSSERVKLTRPQRELLEDLKAAAYGELRLGGPYLRTGIYLARKGLAKQHTQRNFQITSKGQNWLVTASEKETK